MVVRQNYFTKRTIFKGQKIQVLGTPVLEVLDNKLKCGLIRIGLMEDYIPYPLDSELLSNFKPTMLEPFDPTRKPFAAYNRPPFIMERERGRNLVHVFRLLDDMPQGRIGRRAATTFTRPTVNENAKLIQVTSIAIGDPRPKYKLETLGTPEELDRDYFTGEIVKIMVNMDIPPNFLTNFHIFELDEDTSEVLSVIIDTNDSSMALVKDVKVRVINKENFYLDLPITIVKNLK